VSKKQVEFDVLGIDAALDSFAKDAGYFDGDEDERIWEHKPVNIVEFLESSRFMNSKYNKSTGVGVFPCVMDDLVSIFGTNAEDVAPIKRRSYFSEAIGTGKSSRMAWASLYMAYKILCLRNPIQWYNSHGAKLLPNSKISICLLSRTEDNAKDVIFSKANMACLQSEWFNEHYLPDSQVMSKLIFDAAPRNRKQHKLGKIYKNVCIMPGSSSEYSVLGADVVFGGLDECTKFSAAGDRNLTDEDTDQAEVLINALSARITSRFGDLGHLCCVGNPEHLDDTIERYTKRDANNPLVYIVKRRAVWHARMPEFDPDKLDKSGNPVYPHFYFDIEKKRIVPQEVYDRKKKRNKNINEVIMRIPYGPSNQYYEVFRDRPEIALRDYGGVPTQAVGQWWSEAQTVLPQKVNRNRVSPIPEKELHPMPKYSANGEIPDFSNIIDITREDWAWYTIHIDLAENGDSAVLVMSHPTGLTGKSPKIKIDLIYRFKPSLTNPFQLKTIRDLVWWLWKVKKFPIGKVTADKWNSLEMLQAFAMEGLDAEKLSVDSRSQELFDNLKWCIIENRLDFFSFEDFNREIYGLEKNGKNVEKNKYGSDDVAQGVAGSVYNSTQLGKFDEPTWDKSWDLENDMIPGEDFASSAEIW
jgi:hypothetical protein